MEEVFGCWAKHEVRSRKPTCGSFSWGRRLMWRRHCPRHSRAKIETKAAEPRGTSGALMLSWATSDRQEDGPLDVFLEGVGEADIQPGLR